MSLLARRLDRVSRATDREFGEDVAALRVALLSIATGNARIRENPAPEVAIVGLGDASVSVQLRAWVAAADHGAVQSELFEAVLADFSRRGLRRPMLQREVLVQSQDSASLLSPARPTVP